MALDKFRDPADLVWEQRINQLESAEGVGAITGAKVPGELFGSRTLGAWSFSFPEKSASTKLYGLSTSSAAPIVASEATKGVINFAETAPAFYRQNNLAITGRTGKFTLEVIWATNAVEPGVEFTFGFSKIASVAGAEKKVEVKVEAQAAEPIALVATPAASTTALKVSATTGGLAAGQYVPTILLTAGTETAAKSQFAGTMSLILTYS